MVAKRLVIVLFMSLILVGCIGSQPESPARIVLLAPFEGRYREVGYEALYAARLAATDSKREEVELLFIDDGGTIDKSVVRAQALASNPQIKAAVVLGYPSSSKETLAAFAGTPVIVVGNWFTQPIDDHVFLLSSQKIHERMSQSTPISITDAARVDAPFIGGDLLSLNGYSKLRDDFDQITLVSNSYLPDMAYRDRILASDPFASEPRLLSMLVYDAVHMLLMVVNSNSIQRVEVIENLNNMSYSGLTGDIHFEDGYWVDAPIYSYEFSDTGELLPVNRGP